MITRDRKWVRREPFLSNEAHSARYATDRWIGAGFTTIGLTVIVLRPELQERLGQSKCRPYAMPCGTGAGPAVWCHGLLPDYHAFRGSYGGYAFPLS